VSARKQQLSPQQEHIAILAASGLTNKEIAQNLKVGPRAVETQFRRMRDKFGTSNKTETIAVIRQMVLERENKQADSMAGLAKSMPALVLAFDRKYTVVAANTEAVRLLAPARQDAEAGRNLWKQITPGVANRKRLPSLSAETSRDFAGHLVDMTTASGEHRTIAWSSSARSHPVPGWAAWAVGWDVTKLQHNTALRSLLELVSDETPDGVWILDEHMNTLYHNDAVVRILETTSTVIRESTPLDFVPAEMQQTANALLKVGGGTIQIELKTATGKTILVRKRVTFDKSRDGKLGGVLVVIQPLGR